jgi:hypothetical protein
MSDPGLQTVRALTYAHTCMIVAYPQTHNHRQSDEHVALFIARVRERIYRYLYGPRPAFLAPVGWVLTFQVSAISTMWYISVSQVPLPWLMVYLTSRVVADDSFKDQSRHLRATYSSHIPPITLHTTETTLTSDDRARVFPQVAVGVSRSFFVS